MNYFTKHAEKLDRLDKEIKVSKDKYNKEMSSEEKKLMRIKAEILKIDIQIARLDKKTPK